MTKLKFVKWAYLLVSPLDELDYHGLVELETDGQILCLPMVLEEYFVSV